MADRSGNGGSGEGRSEREARLAREALERLLRERLARKPGGHLAEALLARVELDVALDLRREDPRGLDRRLVDAVDALVDDAIERVAAFRPGHAWCHRCCGSGCGHAAPPSPRHVLVAYTPTGTPRWEDFAQLCLERRHPDVDRLFGPRPVLVTIVQDRDELHRDMLRAFRHGRYDLLGQVLAGFFPVPSTAPEGRGVVALTVQVAGSRSRRGALRLGLNVLGRAPSGDPLEQLWDRQDELPWRRAVRWAQAALATIPESVRGGRRELEARVDGILRGLARRLEHDRRGRERRTRHAEARHESGERPTRKAIDDARAAGREELLVDERTGALVVLGDRGRTHFFTTEGQLVSSVRYSRDAIARKIRLELWRPASDAEARTLRDRLPDGS